MKVYTYTYSSRVDVVKEPTDPRIHDESQLLYHVKNELNRMHFDVVKKEMCKDGHMVSDRVYYIRDRKWRFGIYDEGYAIHDIVKEYNASGTCSLDWIEFA